MLIIARGVGNLPTNFGVLFLRLFCSRLMGQHLSDAPRDIATLTFDLAGDTGLRVYLCNKFVLCRPSRSEDMTHFR